MLPGLRGRVSLADSRPIARDVALVANQPNLARNFGMYCVLTLSGEKKRTRFAALITTMYHHMVCPTMVAKSATGITFATNTLVDNPKKVPTSISGDDYHYEEWRRALNIRLYKELKGLMSRLGPASGDGFVRNCIACLRSVTPNLWSTTAL